MNKKLIVFGPFCGEFCYELSWWIPTIRKMKSEKYKDWDAVAVGFDGRKILYEDFTNAYVPYPEELENTLKYPSTFGEHVPGGDIIPDNLHEFTELVANEYKMTQGYDKVEIIDSKYNTNDTHLWSKDWLNNISSKTELLRNLVSEQDLPIVMIDADCMFVKDFYHLLDIFLYNHELQMH